MARPRPVWVPRKEGKIQSRSENPEASAAVEDAAGGGGGDGEERRTTGKRGPGK